MKKSRSARGELVDFDLLAIKQQLSQSPTPVGVTDRRRFIDEKDGVKFKAPAIDALLVSTEAAKESEAAKVVEPKSDKK